MNFINYMNKKFGQFSLSGSLINNYFYVSTENSEIESYIPHINQAEFGRNDISMADADMHGLMALRN